MELLRRALLIGCVLPGLWLLRLAPLDPLLSVVPVDFAAIQKAEAASVPDDRKTEQQRRRAEIPLPVYIEEVLQYNVFSASGPEWERLLQGIDEAAIGAGASRDLARRRSRDLPKPGGGARPVFFRSDEEPIRAALDKLAAGGGTTYVSISRPGEDRHYRVERRGWTRVDFRPGPGFTGTPSPPAFLFYPFRFLGLGSILAGIVFFVLLARSKRTGTRGGPTFLETGALVAGLSFFAAPLALVGGSVQALTRAPWLTIPCWIFAAAGVHFFARPGRNAPHPGTEQAARALFLREGLVFLAMAFGPLVFLISASMILWNR
jgi:hypothetical protein